LGGGGGVPEEYYRGFFFGGGVQNRVRIKFGQGSNTAV
jgi:hypothetical protein